MKKKSNWCLSVQFFIYFFYYSYKNKRKGELGNNCSRKGQQHKKKILRYFKRSALRLIYSDAVRIRRLFEDSAQGGGKENHDYIPLQPTYAEAAKMTKSINSSEINPLGIHDYVTEQYLSGIGSINDEESVQSSQEIESEYWKKQSKEYNEKLGKQSSNVSLWLEFVRFQDRAYRYLFQESVSDKNDTKKSRKNLKALAERKMSILDTAIKKNIRSLDLQFERLEIGQDIWDDKKLKQEWDTVIFNFPNRMRVWHQYIIFMQTHFTSFHLSSVVKTFARCTERLQQMKHGEFLTHSPPPDLGKCIVDVTVQLAHVWRQGGHIEKSIALFQALLELNLFSPKHAGAANTPLEARLVLFEAFWDSRAPRYAYRSIYGKVH